MIDYHVHLWPHAQRASATELRLERLAAYCELAAERGVEEVALTEHLFRFGAAREIAQDFWRREPDGELRASMEAYFAHHATEDLDRYVEAVLSAKAAGLPVVLGLEVDYYPGRMDAVARLLDGYPFDVLLGSVHWLGAWLFDALEDPAAMAVWRARDVDEVWREYTGALEELAATRTCDVLAHPDVVKVTGATASPAALDECYERIAQAAAASQMAAEISSAGWRKPAADAYPADALLRRMFLRGVPVTTASDTHGTENLAERHAELAAKARAAGYGSLRAYRARHARDVALESSPGNDGGRTGVATARGRS